MYHFPCIASGIAVALREGRCPAVAENLQYLYLKSHFELLQVRSLAILNRDQFQGRNFCRISRPPERNL
jgi:hypothetical protein